MASFGSLSIGISGLYANQKGLETVSHNIANADNPNFTRQRVNYVDSALRQSGQHRVGTGTDVSGIKQIRDEFLDKKLRDQVSQYGYNGERFNIFSQVESIINETGEIDDKVTGGLSKTMDDFWKGMDEIVKDPANLTVRGVFKERAEGLVTTVRHMDYQLDMLQKNLDTRVKNVVDETNRITTQIADLNQEIVAAEAGGISANDYKDKRNGLIDRLSQIADISVTEDFKGNMNVAISGTHIVLENSTKQLEYKDSGKGPLVDVYMEGEDQPINKDLKSGELLAILEARGSNGNSADGDSFKNVIPAMREKLDTLIRTIADAINDQQDKGYTLNSTEENKIKGPPMFVAEGGGEITASNIKFNLESLNDIAASDKPGELGNNQNMEAMLKIRDELLYGEDGSENLTMEDFYEEIITDFGIDAKDASNRMDAHGRMIIELDNKKQSISAVSLDEEMANMLKFQHAYSASTRFINAIDEMIDNIINRMAV